MSAGSGIASEGIGRVEVQGARIATGTRQAFLDRIFSLARSGRTSRVLFANVHMVVESSRDPELRAAMDEADLVCPDGMPVARLAGRGKARQERIEGMAVFPLALERACREGVPVAVWGGTEEIHRALRDRVRRDLPGLEWVFGFAPPMAPDPFGHAAEEAALSASGAKIVFVALGCPKQEKWMRRQTAPACFLGVGNAIEVHLGWRHRAPMWARSLCLEWFFRLLQEPRRLFGRYARTNSVFLWRLVVSWLRGKV